MKRIGLLLIIAFASLNVHAVASRYAFVLIPDNLKSEANAVVRTEQMLFTVQGAGKATKKYKIAVTLLNENANYFRYREVHFDKFEKVNYIRASVYDENGKLVKVIRSTDIFDVSAVSGGVLHSDARKKVIRFPLMKYPYTIEYEYETTINSMMNYPAWQFQKSSKVSVEKSGIQYIIPKGFGVKFKEVRMATKVDSVDLKDKMMYTWQVENMPTVKTNAYGIPFEMSTPFLIATPTEFNFDGYPGSNKSWQTFGEWNKKIIENRDVLSDAEVRRVKDLVKDIPNERDKVKAVYEYMQSRTRYVAIALGIGGLQPMFAKDVETKGYGDCKALSNYTMALLKAIGIKSYYTLVLAGSNLDIYPDFVSDQFNHIILCVPQPNDTIWLECTSQSLPFNHLGDFTSDRYVLLTTEQGGKLVRTPSFKKDENLYKKTGTIGVDKLGNLTPATITETFSGVFYSDIHYIFTRQSEQEIKRVLNNSLSLPTFDVEKADFKDNKSEKPSAELTYKINIRDFSTKSASRLFFTPVLSKEDYLLNEPFDVRFYETGTWIDSIEYVLPIGYQIEYLPKNRVVENDFGIYQYELKPVNDKIILHRKVVLNKGKYPKEDFEKVHNFFNTIATTDRERIILKKKEG